MFRLSHAIFSFVHFFIVIGLALTGIILMLLGKSDAARLEMAEALISKSDAWLWVGGVLLAGAILLGMGLYAIGRTAAFRVHMQSFYEVDPQLIQKSLGHFWNQTFPATPAAIDIRVDAKNTIEVIATLQELQEEDFFLEKAEAALGAHLYDLLGYKKDYYVTVQLK